MKKIFIILTSLFLYNCAQGSYYSYSDRYYAKAIKSFESTPLLLQPEPQSGSSNISLADAGLNAIRHCEEAHKAWDSFFSSTKFFISDDTNCRVISQWKNSSHPDNKKEERDIAEKHDKQFREITERNRLLNEKKKVESNYERYISQCEYIGFKRNTEKMGECVLKISETEKKIVQDQASISGGGSSVGNLILLQESLKLLNPPSVAPNRKLNCVYNTVGGILGVNCF